ncbi:MAG: diguanylate cyclase [Magnetococcales bacterium]|nr:diguanylate cyclase [Magnetococcales bacterium]
MDLSPRDGNISASQLDDLVHTLARTMSDRDALQTILDAMLNAVIVVSPDSLIERMNQTACDLLGCSGISMTGRPIDLFLALGSDWKESCMTEMVHQGAIRNREGRFSDVVGNEIPVLFSGSVIRSPQGQVNGFVCSAIDLREQIRLQEALRVSRENFRSIVEKSADGILIVDKSGQVCFLNPAAERLLGRNMEEMMHLPFGYPIIGGEVTEIDVINKNGEVGIAEMRMVETDWRDSPAMLVSLRDVTENVRLREELQQMSMEDPLTGLNNRRGFMILAEQEFKVVQRTGGGLSMIFIDMDGMKQINDTLGHKIGDQALIETAGVLRKVFRKSDVLARQGGDEFLALSFHEPRDDPASTAELITHRIDMEVIRRNALPNRHYTLSLSVGVISIPSAALEGNIEEFIQQADATMYQVKMAKKQGRSH